MKRILLTAFCAGMFLQQTASYAAMQPYKKPGKINAQKEVAGINDIESIGEIDNAKNSNGKLVRKVVAAGTLFVVGAGVAFSALTTKNAKMADNTRTQGLSTTEECQNIASNYSCAAVSTNANLTLSKDSIPAGYTKLATSNYSKVTYSLASYFTDFNFEGNVYEPKNFKSIRRIEDINSADPVAQQAPLASVLTIEEYANAAGKRLILFRAEISGAATHTMVIEPSRYNTEVKYDNDLAYLKVNFDSGDFVRIEKQRRDDTVAKSRVIFSNGEEVTILSNDVSLNAAY